MKNINEYLNEGFFSNAGGSIDSVKKLLAPIFEMNNPNRKRYLDSNIIYNILVRLPKRFGFNIYKYDKSQTEIIESIKVIKEDNDMFWIRYGASGRVVHCDTEITTSNIHSFYFAILPLKVVMTFDGEEVK